MKPYTERQLCKAIEAVDRHLQGEKVKPPKGVELFIVIDEAGVTAHPLVHAGARQPMKPV